LPENKKLVLFGAIRGVNNPIKGFELLVDALNELNPEKFELVVFGSGRSAIVDTLRVKSHFFGTVSEEDKLIMLYAAADVVAVPSYQEVFGQTASEAIACGRPVVAFAHTGLLDIVKHQQTGYLATPFEPADLARGIEWLVADDERYRQLCAEARTNAVEKFDSAVVAGRMIQLYHESQGRSKSAVQSNLKFSIITPSFNQAVFIERTVQSVINQAGFFSVEHIVRDGGSTDGTSDILEKYSGRIRYISEPDMGMQDALNKGFDMATGEIIGWLNSDDTYLPDALRKVADHFNRHPDCLWLYGNCRIVDEHDQVIRKWITAYKNRLSRKYSFERLLVENFISQPAVFMRRSALKDAGPVDPGLPTAMDFDLWLRLAKLGMPGYINDDLACFRVHKDSISSRNFREQFEEQYRIHQRYDQNRWLLFKHRINIRLIVLVYELLQRIHGIFNRN
jgi:glycosyltransferase involved in cell wall biosynthesis